jgi:hypothetical protein
MLTLAKRCKNAYDSGILCRLAEEEVQALSLTFFAANKPMLTSFLSALGFGCSF